MKKIILLTIIALLFTSCWKTIEIDNNTVINSSGSEIKTEEKVEETEKKEYTITWETLKSEEQMTEDIGLFIDNIIKSIENE